MLLFDEMLKLEKRKAFLEYREKGHKYDYRNQQIRDYILSNQYEDDIRRLQEGDYYISVPVKKTIPKGYTNRKRTVYHFKEDEMALFRMMAFVLHDYEHIIPNEVYSFKRGVSAKDLIWKISRNPKLRNMYVVKTDVVNYGNSIDAERLIDMLHDVFIFSDPKADAFFTWLLRRKQFLLDGVLIEGDTAALPGIPIHNFFTNLYLMDIDLMLRKNTEFYARYSDDIIFFQNTREEAEQNMQRLLSELEHQKLTIHNDEKTGIFDPGSPYDFMGFTFEGNKVDISRMSVRKLKRKMRIRAKKIGLDKVGRFETAEQKAKHLIQLNNQTFFKNQESEQLCWSQWAFPVITSTERLHELDLYNQQCIRYVLSGKWSNAAYRVKYSSLKELGYESLVRAYYNEDSK